MLIAMMLMAAAPQTQAAMNQQVGSAYGAADAALNAQYKALMVVMARSDVTRNADLRKGLEKPDGDPGYQAALLASQRAWLAYRDATCKVAGFEFRGGSAQGMAVGQCLTAVTGARTAELKLLQTSLSPK